MMLLSSPQLAPNTEEIGSLSVMGEPPCAATFLILLSKAQNPIHSPSGEKNGSRSQLSVPARSVASG
jgi:hypothetical protein